MPGIKVKCVQCGNWLVLSEKGYTCEVCDHRQPAADMEMSRMDFHLQRSEKICFIASLSILVLLTTFPKLWLQYGSPQHAQQFAKDLPGAIGMACASAVIGILYWRWILFSRDTGIKKLGLLLTVIYTPVCLIIITNMPEDPRYQDWPFLAPWQQALVIVMRSLYILFAMWLFTILLRDLRQSRAPKQQLPSEAV